MFIICSQLEISYDIVLAHNINYTHIVDTNSTLCSLHVKGAFSTMINIEVLNTSGELLYC